MPAGEQRRASMGEILLAIKARLIASLQTLSPPVTANQVVIVSRVDQLKVSPPRAIYLRPRGMRSRRETSRGGGRITTEVDRVLDVICTVQNAKDASYSDELWLTSSEGIWALEDAVLDSLQCWFPEDGDGAFLTISGLELLDDTDPRRDQGKPTWGDTIVSFNVAYQPPMTVPPY